MRNRLPVVALALGFAVGLALSFAPSADAARNGAGTYTLPAGNPVTTGTTITSSWANTTLSDISSELTNSLDRQGRGAMAAPLQISSGTVSAPGLTFSSDPDCGLYRPSANTVRMSAGSTQIQEWSLTNGNVFPVIVTTQAGLSATTSVTGGHAIAAFGNASGNGVVGTGGAASGTGLYGTGGAPNGQGISGLGVGSGAGVVALGGASGGIGVNALGGAGSPGVQGAGGTSSGAGALFYGGSPNGVGLAGLGTGTGAGVLGTGGVTDGHGVSGTAGGAAGYGVYGTGIGIAIHGQGGQFGVSGAGSTTGGTFGNTVAGTATAPAEALRANNGYLKLLGTQPNSTVAVPTNALFATNTVKAWARIHGGATTADDGFNVASVSCASSVYTVNLATGMANSNYSVVCTVTNNGGSPALRYCGVHTVTTTSFKVGAEINAGTINLCADPNEIINVIVIGRQ